VVIKQRDVIAEHEASITDSIKYAYKIQNALFPNQCDFEQVSKDYFIFYKPRDIVSGDFYWIGRADKRMVVVAADCTGHGVPGAMMSMLGVAFLNEIVERDGIAEPGKILDNLRKKIIHALKQHGAEMEQKDGMDIAAIAIDLKTKNLEFAGANNPLYLLRNDELLETKGDKMPVAIHQHMEPFTNHILELHEGDMMYIFSDGYPSQFGGPEGKKLMNKNFRAIILEMKDLPMNEQRDRIEQQFVSWQGNYEQVDDVLVIGLKI
jgi:serine phosphatase RsbU (regulator of sigma subunit)